MKKSGATAIAACALCACSVNDGTIDGPVEMPLYDIVTFEGNDNDAHAHFSLIPNGDMEPVALTADRPIDPDLADIGERMVIAYTNEPERAAYTSGNISLRSASKVNGSPATAVPDPADSRWNRDPVYVIALWRAGSYINLRSRLPYSTSPRLFALWADKETLQGSWVDMYLAHALPDSVNRATTYPVANYASFSIDSIWSLPTTRGVIIHVNNSHMPDEQSFRFDKQ